MPSPFRALCAAVILLAACPAVHPLWAQPALTEDTLAADEANPIKVELLNPGEEPRALIRFRPAVGAKRVLVMTMDMQQQAALGGVPLPATPMPTQKVTIEFAVDQVASNGDVSLGYKYTNWEVLRAAGVAEQMAAAIEQSVKPMIGTVGTLVATDRGFPKDASISIPEGVPPQLRAMAENSQESIRQIAAPAPEEAVGVGAEWRVSSRVTANGMAVDQSTTYKLLEIKGDAYKLQVDVAQDAEEQQVVPPGFPPGAVLMLKALDSSGSGETVLTTSSVVPQRTQMEMTTKADMEVQAGGQSQAMTMNMIMKLGLAPVSE